ncbi:endonuclease III domain-containing protein [Clostridiisalibacter paucivorans]|uniref:endonuclease III domain-containing protein n=1 Tax=Clostridiisalibacter paucivorans TaxID=408753 RepID=UPI00047CC544|nr:endonuclease III domain-containing protein [Clostridiisalibacter paucivorans]
MSHNKIQHIYNVLHETLGVQNWWPADSQFEVIIGAILTQNTSWNNVEKAIKNLKPFLTPEIIYEMDIEKLAILIKPSGFFNIKAKRIKNFLNWFYKYDFSIDRLEKIETEKLRNMLLSINGIGKETADSILLYALDKEAFVVDAYTKRIMTRIGITDNDNYDILQKLFIDNLPKNTYIYNEYHALIVSLAKKYCRKNPICNNCPLNMLCKHVQY